jgi:phosphatidylglycerophosphate synthase
VVSFTGILLDPIVDKLFLLVSVGFFTWLLQVPFYFLALLGFRFLGQFLLFGWALWKKNRHYPYRPHFLTKLSAFTCYTLVFILLIGDIYPNFFWMNTLKSLLLVGSIALECLILLVFVPDIFRFTTMQSPTN